MNDWIHHSHPLCIRSLDHCTGPSITRPIVDDSWLIHTHTNCYCCVTINYSISLLFHFFSTCKHFLLIMLCLLTFFRCVYSCMSHSVARYAAFSVLIFLFTIEFTREKKNSETENLPLFQINFALKMNGTIQSGIRCMRTCAFFIEYFLLIKKHNNAIHVLLFS